MTFYLDYMNGFAFNNDSKFDLHEIKNFEKNLCYIST